MKSDAFEAFLDETSRRAWEARPTGRVSLANPLARPGKQNDDVTVTRIENIPDDVQNATVARAWEQTANLTWLGSEDPLAGGRFVFDWSEIGPGRIVR